MPCATATVQVGGDEDDDGDVPTVPSMPVIDGKKAVGGTAAVSSLVAIALIG